jgi:hypothetical protein
MRALELVAAEGGRRLPLPISSPHRQQQQRRQ